MKRFMSREIITYLIAGGLTTVVNFLVSYLMYNLLGVNENITTVAAWVVAVAFAYLINNFWVFKKGNEGIKKESAKAGKFVAARLFTLAVEWFGILIFVTNLEVNFWLVKIPLAVIVTLLNYIFSKLFIFMKSK